MSNEYPNIPVWWTRRSFEATIERSRVYRDQLRQRRSVRYFSYQPASFPAIANTVAAAGSSETRPWIRAVKAEQREGYERRMLPEWQAALVLPGPDRPERHRTDAANLSSSIILCKVTSA